MRNFFSLMLVCLFTLPALAQNSSENIPLSETDANIFEFTSGVFGKVSVSVYIGDGGLWVVEQRTIAADGLPDLISENSFRSKQSAWNYARSLGVTINNDVPEALDVPAPEVLNIPGLTPSQGLWKASNNWSWEWELKFAAWMRKNLHPQFFQALKIENDCADAYYQARIIFARLYKLPVSFRLASTGAWFTNNTLRADWKKLKTNEWTEDNWLEMLKADQRFLKVLDYIADNTYTHTLGRDTYPVAITKEGLIEGTAYLSLHGSSGHTLLVNEINLNNVNDENKARLPMYTLNSTVPKGVQPLTESFFFSGSQPEATPLGKTGFVRFRWPVSVGATELVAMDKMPNYSEEQYSADFLQSNPDLPEDDPARTNFSLFVFKRLNPDFDPVLRVTEGISLLGDLLKQRDQIVNDGYMACKAGCDPAGAVYDAWSTPSRDARIKELIQDLETYQSYLYGIETVTVAWQKALASDIVTLEGTSYPFSLVKWIWQNELFSTDPNQTPGVRWGVNPESFALASYDAIAPKIQARKEKIESTPPCIDCSLFSPEFLKASTYSEDQLMNETVVIRAQYCVQAGPALCKRFEAALASYPTVAPGQTSFLDTWQNISTLNSDPRVSSEARWGKLVGYEDVVRLDGTWYALPEVSKDGLLGFTKDEYPANKLTVVDTVSKKVLFTNTYSTYAAWTMDVESSQIAGRVDEKKEIFILDAFTGAELQRIKYSIPDGDYIYELRWASPDTIVVKSYQTLMMMERGEAGQFAITNTINGNYTLLSSSYGAAADLEKVVIYDLLKKQSDVISIKGMFGNVQPSSISVERSSDTAAIVSWYYYDNITGDSSNGRIFINLTNKTALPINNKIYPNSILDGFTFVSNEENTKTSLIFLDDNLQTLEKLDFTGACSNCWYVERFVQVGQDIVEVDKQAKAFRIVATVPPGVTLSRVFDNIMTLNYYNETTTEYSASAVSLTDGKVQVLAPSVDLTSTDHKSFYPYVVASYYISKTLNENTPEAQYFSYYFYSTLDPLNYSAGSILTSPNYGNGGGDCGGGDCCEDCGEGHFMEGDMMAGLLPTLGALTDEDYTAVKLTAPVVTIKNGGVVATETQRPLRLLNISDKQTILIFNK